jgi:DNA polymerase III subunit beta
MTIEVSVIELSKAVSIVARAANNKVNAGYPNAFRLTASSADKNRLTLSAFDLSTAIECSINAMISSKLDVVVSAQMLKDILSSSQGDRVELNDIPKKSRIGISSLRCNWDVGYLKPDDYPLAPELADDETYLSLSATDLVDLFGTVAYAASNDETRPVITAINVQFVSVDHKVLIKSAATDGHRLSVANCAIETDYGSANLDLSINIPVKAIRDLIGIIKSDDVSEDIISVRFDDSMIKFEWTDDDGRDRMMLSRLIDGDYPQYQQLIAPSFASNVVIDRQNLLAAVNRASIIARSSNNKIIIQFSEDGCSVKADQELGGSIEEIEDIELNGAEQSFVFNYKYVIDALKNISTTKVKIQFNESNTPVVLSGDTDESSISDIHLLAPITDTNS